MALTLDEAKMYLRVDSDYEDELILNIMETATRLCKDVGRLDDADIETNGEALKIPILYACAYLYEHREEADHKALTLSLRALLFGVREAQF